MPNGTSLAARKNAVFDYEKEKSVTGVRGELHPLDLSPDVKSLSLFMTLKPRDE